MKKTKIIATIGPSSSSKEILKKMIKAGMNVARINFSHGDHSSNGELIKNIKELREELDLPVGIMADLEGPRVRVLVDEDTVVNNGDKVIIADMSLDPNFKFEILNFKSNLNEKILNDKAGIIKLDKEGIIKTIEVGNEILIEDGKIKLKVIEKNENGLLAEVLAAGVIKNHKGVNIPEARLPFGALSEKDVEDLEFVLSEDVDFIALSFVGNAKDIIEAKEKIKEISGKDKNLPLVVSKIERKEAIKNIDEIIEATDAVMVARGDLGIEMPETKVVIFQKEIIGKCLAQNKPVIVATQMMESMIKDPLPTRAEVSDVTNAVIDHTDAVMLSGESANGKYPVETVEIMAKIITDTEESRFDDDTSFVNHMEMSEYESVIHSANEMAKNPEVKAIILFSFEGNTSRFMSGHRPNKAILMATNNAKTFEQSSILWGVTGYKLADEKMDNFAEVVFEKAKKDGFLQKGDKTVIIMGRLPSGEKMRMVGIKEVA